MPAASKNRTKQAVGLSYDSHKDQAPTVSVKGQNVQAEMIVKIAQRYGIPVVKKRELSAVLSNLNLDQQIPGQIFEAVAQIMVQIDKNLK